MNQPDDSSRPSPVGRPSWLPGWSRKVAARLDQLVVCKDIAPDETAIVSTRDAESPGAARAVTMSPRVH